MVSPKNRDFVPQLNNTSSNIPFLYKITIDNNFSMHWSDLSLSLNEFRSISLKVVRGIGKDIVRVLQGIFAKGAKTLFLADLSSLPLNTSWIYFSIPLARIA